MKKILVINLGWEQEPLLDLLKEYSVEIYGIHHDDNYYKNVEYKDIYIADFRDLESILNYAKKIKVDAVISDQCDYSYFAQSLIAETLNLPGVSIKNAQIATNKYLQRVKAKENNVLVPEFMLCSNTDEIQKFVKKHGYPVIVKPIDNRGSFGVNRVNEYSDIAFAFNDAMINSYSRLVLIEVFIEGTHITVDGYCFKNSGPTSLTIAMKELMQGDRQVAISIQYPALFEQHQYNEILKINEKVNKALEYDFGMTHSEYMITSNFDVYLIESANRGGGVYTSELIVPSVSGVDIVNQYICDILNISKDFYKKNIEKNKIILKFFNFKSGKIKDIYIDELFLLKKEILKVKLFVQKGDIIRNITTDANRHGFIIAENEYLDIDEEISKYIRVIYEE